MFLSLSCSKHLSNLNHFSNHNQVVLYLPQGYYYKDRANTDLEVGSYLLHK